MRVGYISDEAYLRHNTGKIHPESSERLRIIEDEIASLKDDLILLTPCEVSFDILSLVHPYEYIEYVKECCENGMNIDGDTITSKGSFEAALKAVGAGIKAVYSIKKGEIDRAFAAVRPPGHHASRQKAMGFCLFNNIAVTAIYAQKQGYKKVFIIDFDVHHGNGTQDIFYEDSSVFYFSTHEKSIFPGTGDTNDIGSNKGAGYTFNYPLEHDSKDTDILKVYQDVLPPLIENFNPDIILVSAGYDIHIDDPLASLNVSLDGIRKLIRTILKMKDVPYVFMLEGGYDVDALAESVKVTLEEMLQ